MTRIYTDEAEVQGCSGKTSGASEPDSLASELAYSPVSESLHSLRECGPAFRALSEIKKLPRIGIQKKHGAGLACRDGGVFEKTSASSLARGFAKRPHHSRSE